MKRFLMLTPFVFAALCLAQLPLSAQNARSATSPGALPADIPAERPAPALEQIQAVTVADVEAPAPETILPAQSSASAPMPAAAQEGEGFVLERETINAPAVKAQETTVLVTYAPKNRRDPTLSPDDFLLLQYREQQRLAAVEAERQRKLAEERRKREEAERQRQLELARIKDPTREVRNKIRVGGIIGQEVFVGSRIYTVGKSILGARIVEVRPDEVVFSYKGHKFTKKVQLN